MADEEQKQPVLEEVNPSELGQLSPGYTPYVAKPQNSNRGKELSRGGESRQLGKATGQPQFTELESQDLSAAAQETAVHLHQAELDSREREKFSSRVQEATKQQPQESAKESGKEPSQEIEKNQEKEPDHER